MAQDLAMQSPNNILNLTLQEEVSFQSIDETPELRDIPPIRDNPEMAQSTAKRRSSVANPNSIQYRDPAISTDSSPNDQSSTDEEHGDDPAEDSEDDDIGDVFSAINENISHDGDPSLSDLNEINERQHYQPINQRDGTEQHSHSQSQIQAQAEEDDDPFARLGQKQQSVALPPLISRLQHQQERLQQIQRAKQQQIQQMHAMPPPQNPYTPENVLDPKHLQQRHTRAGSKHSRSQTLVTASGYHNNQSMQPQLKQRHNRRHQHKSSSVDWSADQMSGPPLGPDLTFVCMRIENRTILQDGLSDSNFLQLMQIHNAIMLDRLKHFHGHCIESNNGHIYDVLTVFNDVYDAMRYAINVQKELNAYTWPSFLYQLESQSSRMQYVGKGNQGAFNGLRVGMGLHTATVDSHGNINKYDGGKETLTVKTVIFDAHYQGSAVELAKNLCLVAYGGELLASKAVSQALLRSKKGGDEISIQRLGSCKIANIRKVELIQLIPRDLPHRMFPPRSFKSFKALNTVQPHQPQVSVLGNILNDVSETPSYDPFPAHESDKSDDEEEYHSDNSHSSKDEIQHNPRISNPRRRPSITQIGHVGPDTQIEVSFNGGDDDLDDYKHDYDHNLLGVNVYGQDVVNNMDSDHSIGPPKQHKSRSKAQEIEKRKSVIQGIDNSFLRMVGKEQSKKKRNKKQKTKAKRQASGRDGDDEHSPLPDDSDYGQDNISKPRRGPRANKKQEHYKTLIGIDFDPDADSSVYSAGSRSIRTSTTVKSYNKLLNPQHQLKLYKVQPPNLPSAYSDDKEFTCLACQEIHKWTDGVWRVPLWPSFDVCIVCGNKALQTGTSKKDYTNFDPTGAHNTLIYSPQDAHNSFGDLNAGKHRKVPSTAPILKEYIETVNGNNEYKITQEALEMLRKQLSSIIEELTNQKMCRLDNLSKWANNDAEFDEFRTKTIAEHKTTEDDINHWRRKAKRLDEQDQRVLRRRNTVNLDGMSPNASDLESDEELHQNWQDYDYKDDFAHINDRIKDLDALFWTEDQFYRKKFENTRIANREKFKLLQQQYSQTTHELQQRNDELTTKITALIQQNDNINTYQLGSEETDSDDLDNDNMAKYSKYVPPSIKHIHENSEVKDEEFTDANALEDKVQEQNSMIDHYISTVNRKDRELRQSQQAIAELKSKILYLENLTEQEEEFAAIHDELQRTRQEKRVLETKLSTSHTNTFHSNDRSDDSSFNEPIPSEHPSPVLAAQDMEYKEEEKSSTPSKVTVRTATATQSQSQPRLSISAPSSANIIGPHNASDITPDTMYHLTRSLDVDDLPIPIEDDEEHKSQIVNTKLSQLFVGGGKQYWQDVKESYNISQNPFYHTNGLPSMFEEDLDISAMGLQFQQLQLQVVGTPPTNISQNSPVSNLTNYNPKKYHLSAINKAFSPVTPVTPQPSQSRMRRKLNVNKNEQHDPYQNAERKDNVSSSDNSREMEEEDESKYGNGDGLPSSKTSGVVMADNVPFAIAALFHNIQDPNPIKSEAQLQLYNKELLDLDKKEEEKSDDENVTSPDMPPVLVSMQSFKEDAHKLESIEDRYKKAQRHASNPEIIVPGSNLTDMNRKITIYEPIIEEHLNPNNREKSSSPEKHDPSPSPDDHALTIDYQLETVAKSKIVRRLSFPLGKIDEHPQLELAATASPISPIDDGVSHPAFGSLIFDEEIVIHDVVAVDEPEILNEEKDENKSEAEVEVDVDAEEEEVEDYELQRPSTSVDKESIISDLESDEKDSQSDDDTYELQIDRDHNTMNMNMSMSVDDGGGGTANDFRGKQIGNHNHNHNHLEQKERDDQVLIDAQLFKDNQIRLKAANVTIDRLQDEIDGIVDENSRLAKGKMQLLNKTSQQMEVMRDELQNMCKQLQIKDYTIKKLIHINKEGYDPDIDQKDDTRKTSISYLGINNPITGLLTFGRSKFSSSVHTLADSKKSKIDLAISTAAEIQRLREIIAVLSTQTTHGNATQNGASQSHGLLNGAYPGSY